MFPLDLEIWCKDIQITKEKRNIDKILQEKKHERRG